MKKTPSAQFLFKNINQKSRKNWYQTFLFLSNITEFLYFVPNISSGIVDYSLVNCCWRLSITRVLGCTCMSHKYACLVLYMTFVNICHSSSCICTTYVLLTISNMHQQVTIDLLYSLLIFYHHAVQYFNSYT